MCVFIFLCVFVCVHAASCRVDARQLEGSSLHIRKLRPPASDCQMKVDSVLKEEATVRAGAELWFQDCLPNDLQVTVSRTIGNVSFSNALDPKLSL